MEVLQDMTTRRLKNLRVKATTGLLLGGDNDDAIKSIDDELKRRVPVKKRSAKQQLADLAKSTDPVVRRRVNEVNKIAREAEERMAKLQKKQKKIKKAEEPKKQKLKEKKPKRIIAKVGMKVDVFSPDKKKHLGKGVIVKVDDLIVEETGEVLSHNYPTIRLENGKKIGGIKCWWSPI